MTEPEPWVFPSFRWFRATLGMYAISALTGITLFGVFAVGFYLGGRSEALYGKRVTLVDCAVVLPDNDHLSFTGFNISGHDVGVCFLDPATTYIRPVK